MYWFLAFSIPFTFLALRYDIGRDYQSYVNLFNNIKHGQSVIQEPAYVFINEMVIKFGLDVQWVFVIFGFLFMYFAYKTIPKKGFALCIFIFICSMYLYEGFNIMRQGLATAMMTYAIRYIYDKNFFKYSIYAVVAMLFHFVTGAIFLLVYPLANKKYNRWLMLSMLGILFFVVMKTDIILSTTKDIAGQLPMYYSIYANSKYMEAANYSSGLGVLAKLMIGVVIIFYKDAIVKKFTIANIIVNLYFLFLLCMILHIDVIIIRRIEHMFIFFQVLAITYFVLTIDKKSRIFVSMVIGLLFLAMFNLYIKTGTLESGNSVYISPYQSILDK